MAAEGANDLPQVDDRAANETVRRVATRGAPIKRSAFPTLLAERLYRHLDWMREELFDGELPEVVLSFDATNRKMLGHYVLGRNSVGLRWNVNLNRKHAHRPLYQVLATLLHELVHVWQDTYSECGKAPYHNQEFQQRAGELGVPTDRGGHYYSPPLGGPFHAYCLRHEVPWEQPPAIPRGHALAAARAAFDASDAGAVGPAFDDGHYGEPPPMPPVGPDAGYPPVGPVGGGSKLKKWTCGCGVNARVAIADFDATCNKCGTVFKQQG